MHIDEGFTPPCELARTFIGVIVHRVEELRVALLNPAAGDRASHGVDVADDEATAGSQNAIGGVDSAAIVVQVNEDDVGHGEVEGFSLLNAVKVFGVADDVCFAGA